MRQLQQHVPPAEPAGRTETRRLRPRGLRVVPKPVPVAQRARCELLCVLPARQQPGVVHAALLRLAAAVLNKLTWVQRARPGLAVHSQPGGAAQVGAAALLLLCAHRHGHPERAREEADSEPDLPVRRRQFPLLQEEQSRMAELDSAQSVSERLLQEGAEGRGRPRYRERTRYQT